jgi:hypothetical protein
MTRTHAAVAVLVLGLLSPEYQVAPGLPALRGEDVVLVLFLLFLRPFDWRATPPTPEGRRVGRAFAAMGLLAFASIPASTFLYGTKVILSDFVILPMLFRYYLIFCVGRSLAGPAGREAFLKAALSAFLLCAVVGIVQQFDVFGAAKGLVTRVYGASTAQYAMEGGVLEERTGGTHGDGRYFGALVCYGVAVALPVVLLWPTSRMRLAAGTVLLALLLALLGPMSRTPVSMGACMLVVGVFARYRRNLARGAIRLLLAAGAVTLIFGQYRAVSKSRADTFEDRVFRSDSGSFRNSQGARIRDLLLPFNDALRNPAIFVIGRGPAKSEMRTCSHNDFGWYFHRFGLMGLGFYLLLLYWGLRLAWRRFVRSAEPSEQAIALAGVLVVVGWAVFAGAESVWKDGQVMTVTMFLYGLVHAPSMPVRGLAVRRAIRSKWDSVTLRPALLRPVRVLPWRGVKAAVPPARRSE